MRNSLREALLARGRALRDAARPSLSADQSIYTHERENAAARRDHAARMQAQQQKEPPRAAPTRKARPILKRRSNEVLH